MRKIVQSLIYILLMTCLFFSHVTFAQEIKESGEENQIGAVLVEIGNYSETEDLLRYTLISNMGISLSIKNRIATIYTECKTYDNADITLIAELQRNNGSGTWSTIKTYTKTESNKNICKIDETYAVTMGYEYRIKLSATVYVGNQTESDTRYGNNETAYSIELD